MHMKYAKPEITVFAPAVSAVRGGTKGDFVVQDMSPDTRFHSIPAYEAEE
jgi:hypothetical protein